MASERVLRRTEGVDWFVNAVKTETRIFFLNNKSIECFHALAQTIRREGLIKTLSCDTALFRA